MTSRKCGICSSRLFHRHISFVHLGDIHRIAAAQLGFQGPIGEAAELLSGLLDMRIEVEPTLSESRVYASADGVVSP